MPTTTHRRARRVLSLGLALTLFGCSAQPRLYNRIPVDSDGGEIPLSNATKVVFEDGTSYSIGESELLSIRKDSLRASGSKFGTAVWSLAQVEGIEWRGESGDLQWSDVRTPEDLRAFVTLPRVERIIMDDGTSYVLEEQGYEARMDPAGLYILLAQNQDWETATQLELARIESVQLFEPNLASATIRSPMFWLASVAAGVAILLVSGNADPKTTATR
jgi:hypothetical protein